MARKNPPARPPKAAPIIHSISGTASHFPIVGIGASAGGLAAFEDFFSGMPVDTDLNMAFVLVQHLAPDHKSILTELIRRYTRMQVFEVEDGMEVNINCAYIIPPNYDMAFIKGTLRLSAPIEPRGQRLPIDFFFYSLAADQGYRAIAIVLSGTGSDGTLGVRAIKSSGGMVIAQLPKTSQFDGMPVSAIATGVVDFQLAPLDMPAKLLSYNKNSTDALQSPQIDIGTPKSNDALQKIFGLLLLQVGHDFSDYKPNSIVRRIARRMAANEVGDINDYVKFLQNNKDEIQALFRDLLIGVTRFFRDHEAFSSLEKLVIPRLFYHQPKEKIIRVWTIGCSTGEEAYSIAILILEKMETLKINREIKIFCTDIDPDALQMARKGVYPEGIAADISSERLSKFFTYSEKSHSYRVHKRIRDMMIFSIQNVIRDPPFSRIDVISCRNVLIYMNKELQRKLLFTFHYSLNPGGSLFLGSSENIASFPHLFTVIDRKYKLFCHTEDLKNQHQFTFQKLSDSQKSAPENTPSYFEEKLNVAKPSLQNLTEGALLQHMDYTAALVDRHGDILYLHGRSGLYLEPTPGATAVSNILKMSRQGLRLALTVAFQKSTSLDKIIKKNDIKVKTNGDYSRINLTICPVESELFLIIFEEKKHISEDIQGARLRNDGALLDDSVLENDGRMKELMQELHDKDNYLQATNEALESSNEELKSSNEELQSINEEMQSTNEELETSKEELQSLNEELATVNTELKNNMEDLSILNNDMNNLLAGTGIATIFIDHQLCIMRFTPSTTAIINLLPSDQGRPLKLFVSNLKGYDEMIDDVKSVLDTLSPCVVEVETKKSRWYRLSIVPYRTLENVIEGAVLTFIDITEIRNTRDQLAHLKELSRLAAVMLHAGDAMVVQDTAGHIIAWNASASNIYGWTEEEAIEKKMSELIPNMSQEQALDRLKKQSKDATLRPYKAQRLTKSGKVIAVWITSTALKDENGAIYGFATLERFISREEKGEGDEKTK
jgi:two-component system CheB/CheR fusion protein